MGTPLTPVYTDAPESLLSETFDSWASKGWVETTDIVGPSLWGANGAFAESRLADPGPAEFSQLVRTLSGFPPDTLVRIAIGLDWNLGVGCPGGPGTTVPGLLFGGWLDDSFQQLPGPAFFSEGAGFLVWTARTDSSGEVEARVGVVGMQGSFNIQGGFSSIEVTSVVTDFSDIIIDSATLVVDGAQPSISRGALSFDPGEEWEDYMFPGRTMNVLGCRELVRLKPVIKGNLMMVGEQQIAMYRPDGTWANHASLVGARTYTLGALRSALATGSYLTNVYCVWKRQRGDYIAVEFPNAICGKYSIGSNDADEGLIPVELEAVQDITGLTTKTGIPYRIHTFPAETVLDDL